MRVFRSSQIAWRSSGMPMDTVYRWRPWAKASAIAGATSAWTLNMNPVEFAVMKKFQGIPKKTAGEGVQRSDARRRRVVRLTHAESRDNVLSQVQSSHQRSKRKRFPVAKITELQHIKFRNEGDCPSKLRHNVSSALSSYILLNKCKRGWPSVDTA